jgi:hypothetical protein
MLLLIKVLEVDPMFMEVVEVVLAMLLTSMKEIVRLVLVGKKGFE